MITQVIFKIDKKIKEQAQKKARARGLTFSDVLKMASYQYVEGGFEPMLQVKEEFRPAIARSIKKSLENIEAGKNLSPVFNTATEMFDHLEKGIKDRRKKKRAEGLLN